MESPEKPSKAFVTSCSEKAAEKQGRLDRSEHAQHWVGMGYSRGCPTGLSTRPPVSTLQYLL